MNADLLVAPWNVRARVRGWLTARLPRTDTQLLTQGNVYILPTQAGWMFAVTLVVLLLASINYQLNLGYVLTFLLAGSGVVSMHVTHGTLRGLTLHLRPVAPGFAGEPVVLDIVLTSPGTPRFGIGLRLLDAPGATLAWIDVPGGGQATAHVSFVPAVRGLHEVPTLSAETRFPLGLFRAWTVWRPAARHLVYPRPESPAPAPPSTRPIVGGPTRSAASVQAASRDSRSSGAIGPQAVQSSQSSWRAETLVSRLTSSEPVSSACAAFFHATSFIGSPRR